MEIEHFEKYLVYSDGTVFNNKTKKFIKITTYTSSGHSRVTLTHNKVIRSFTLSRLVATYYLNPPEGESFLVGYKDGNKNNVCVENLILYTNSEAMKVHWKKKKNKHFEYYPIEKGFMVSF